MLMFQASKAGTVYSIIYQGEATDMTSRQLRHWFHLTINTLQIKQT